VNDSRPEARDGPVRPSHDPRTCFSGSHERIEPVERLEIPVSPGMERSGQHWPMRSMTDASRLRRHDCPPHVPTDICDEWTVEVETPFRRKTLHQTAGSRLLTVERTGQGQSPSQETVPVRVRALTRSGGQPLPDNGCPPLRLPGCRAGGSDLHLGVQAFRGEARSAFIHALKQSAYMVLIDPLVSEAAARSEVACATDMQCQAGHSNRVVGRAARQAPVRHGSVCQRTSSKVATSVSMP
jgi:hypothetical protein